MPRANGSWAGVFIAILAALLVIGAIIAVTWAATRTTGTLRDPLIQVGVSVQTEEVTDAPPIVVVVPPPPVPPATTLLTWTPVTTPILECAGYDGLMMLRNDTLYLKTVVSPVSSSFFLLGQWSTNGTAGCSIPGITTCQGGEWDRASFPVVTPTGIVLRVDSPGRAALLLVTNSTVRLLRVLPASGDNRPVIGDAYTWSASQHAVYLAGRHAPLLSDSLVPTLVDSSRSSGTQFLAARSATDGVVRLLLHTSSSGWAASPSRFYRDVHLPPPDALVDGPHLAWRGAWERVSLLSDGARGLLHLIGTDARSPQSRLMSARSCRAEDVYPRCTPLSPTPISECVPDPHALASACVAVSASLLAAFHAVSADDGLSWQSPARTILAQGNDQSVARGSILLPSGLVAVVYESTRPGHGFEALQLRLWVSNGYDTLLDTLDGYAQAYSNGGSAWDGGDPLPMRVHGEHHLNVTYSRPVSGTRPAAYDVTQGIIDVEPRSSLVTLTVWVGPFW
jgi:hypothetical protein